GARLSIGAGPSLRLHRRATGLTIRTHQPQPLLLHLFPQFRSLVALLQQPLHLRRARRCGGSAQKIGLRILTLFQPGPPAGVGFAGAEKLLEAFRPPVDIEGAKQLHQRARLQLQGPMAVGVILTGEQRQLLTFARRLAALVYRLDRGQPLALVTMVFRPETLRRATLAQIMEQAGPARRQWQLHACSLLQHQQHMLAGIDLRMMGLRLRYTEQAVDFRQQLCQGSAIAQHPDEDVRAIFHQRPADFLPAALGCQLPQLAGLGQLAHELQRLVSHAKAQRRIAGGETGNPQHPQGVFGKSRRYMPQQAVSDVLLASIGVDDFALVVHGHGVDGQVAALQVLFQRNLGGGMESETAVAATALAFGSGEGVFLSGLRVEEYREVLADRAEAEVQQLLRRGADHYPVTLM